MTETLMIFAILGYLAYIFQMGTKEVKRKQYLKGGHPPPQSSLAIALCNGALDMSSWILMGLPGLAYLTGVADAGWTALGLALGTFFNWKVVAQRLRRYAHTVNAQSLPHFFAERFGDRKHRVSALASWIMVFFFTSYVASAFVACGKLFSTMFDVDYGLALMGSGAMILVYSLVGGLPAMSFTHLVQSVLMSMALVFVLSYALGSVGGVGVVWEYSQGIPGYLSLFEGYAPGAGEAEPFPFFAILSALSWGLGYFGMPHILLRFMGNEAEEKLPAARNMATVWVAGSMALAIVIGLVGKTMADHGVIPDNTDGETVVLAVAQLLGDINPLLAVVAGLILAGILSAAMSTAESQLMVVSRCVTQNLMVEKYGKKLSSQKKRWTGGCTMATITVVAMMLARNPESSVLGLVSFAWAGFGASFGPVMLLGLYWRRATLRGAMWGMFSGALTVIIWRVILAPSGGMFGLYELLPGFVTCLTMMVAGSLLTDPPSEEVELLYDASLTPIPK